MVTPQKHNVFVLLAVLSALFFLAACGTLGSGMLAAFCPDCKGDGNRTACATCWGEGLRVEERKITYDRCSTCFGTGQNTTMNRTMINETLGQYTMLCPSCSGRGRTRIVTPVRVYCEPCEGTGEGRTKIICARCEGTGSWRGVFRSGKNRKGWIAKPSTIILPGSP